MKYIEQAKLTDCRQIAALEEECFNDPWSYEMLLLTLDSPYERLYVFRDDHDLLGYAVISISIDDYTLSNLAIAPAHRRQGLGMELLFHLLKAYADKDFLLEVRQSNSAAIALYEKAGFVQDGFRKRYYQNPAEGAVLMRRRAQDRETL